MTWLLFIDESGHDHRTTPYEVQGGFAIHVRSLWPFVQAMRQREFDCFGCQLHEYKKEIKGATLLSRKRYRFAGQGELFPDEDRRKLCRSFLTKGDKTKNSTPSRDEFTAYGQSCLLMAQEIMRLLQEHGAILLASAIPQNVAKPPAYQFDDYLRKDIVFLLERFFYLLEEKGEHGVIVMDETEEHQDRRLISRMERYFTRTNEGQSRTVWIVPTPFFVSSDMTHAIQAADVCIYCVNWGFRLPQRGMDAEQRNEIATMFGARLANLQFRGGQRERDGRTFEPYGIIYVPDPYEARSTP